MLCLKYSILQATMSALFVMWLKLCRPANSWHIEMLLSWRTYRNSTVGTWLLATWSGTVAKMNCMNYLTFCNFRLQLCISCICLFVVFCLSVCVCLLCGGRIKIVNLLALHKHALAYPTQFAVLPETDFVHLAALLVNLPLGFREIRPNAHSVTVVSL